MCYSSDVGVPESVKKFLTAAGRKGGLTRSKRLSAAQRHESARDAALARWARLSKVERNAVMRAAAKTRQSKKKSG